MKSFRRTSFLYFNVTLFVTEYWFDNDDMRKYPQFIYELFVMRIGYMMYRILSVVSLTWNLRSGFSACFYFLGKFTLSISLSYNVCVFVTLKPVYSYLK